MYNPKDIIDLIADNVRKTKNPFGVPKFAINDWWKKANVPQKGDALLFTGLMYQFVPYIEKSTSYLTRFEDTKWADTSSTENICPNCCPDWDWRSSLPGEKKRDLTVF